jgi:hypothetical protein
LTDEEQFFYFRQPIGGPLVAAEADIFLPAEIWRRLAGILPFSAPNDPLRSREREKWTRLQHGFFFPPFFGEMTREDKRNQIKGEAINIVKSSQPPRQMFLVGGNQ